MKILMYTMNITLKEHPTNEKVRIKAGMDNRVIHPQIDKSINQYITSQIS